MRATEAIFIEHTKIKALHTAILFPLLSGVPMRSYQGVVLFVDMLGFSALTRGKLKLTAAELHPWNVDPDGDFPNQILATKIIIAFRQVLAKTKKKYGKIKVAQLSDCAFLWSPDAALVAKAGKFLLRQAASIGLLCRGGLAYGDIHEPDKLNHSLGAFVVGDAVTRAATSESVGKGTRVFTDSETAQHFSTNCPQEEFKELENPLTGEIVDEWQWYALPRAVLDGKRSTLEAALLNLATWHATLRYSPKLAWSATTSEGYRQISCSIAAISDHMNKLSGGRPDFKFTVEGLMQSSMDRSHETVLKVSTQFAGELLAATRPRHTRTRPAIG
jgi:hypothetical protein